MGMLNDPSNSDSRTKSLESVGHGTPCLRALGSLCHKRGSDAQRPLTKFRYSPRALSQEPSLCAWLENWAVILQTMRCSYRDSVLSLGSNEQCARGFAVSDCFGRAADWPFGGSNDIRQSCDLNSEV